MCPGSGEWGRGRVGEVLVRIRLFRLLVRQLRESGGAVGGRPGTPLTDAPPPCVSSHPNVLMTPKGTWGATHSPPPPPGGAGMGGRGGTVAMGGLMRLGRAWDGG